MQTARVLAAQHAVRIRESGVATTTEETLERDARILAYAPLYEAGRRSADASRSEAAARDDRIRLELASLDARPVTSADVTRIARRRMVEDGAPGALSDVETQVRRDIAERRSAAAGRAAADRERELARLSQTGLADMPREIARAAEDNLRDARSPFDTRLNWRPSADDVRAEEVRLRDAVIRHVEAARRDAASRAAADTAASRRETVLQSCRMQAAMMGAAVPSPWMGPGLGGAIASGIMGAVQQASMEANALQSCLRASGY